jgi:ABC-type sugar transport system substrate-binding protein
MDRVGRYPALVDDVEELSDVGVDGFVVGLHEVDEAVHGVRPQASAGFAVGSLDSLADVARKVVYLGGWAWSGLEVSSGKRWGEERLDLM